MYETKNLRKAAELLFLSHSALSKSLKVLQEEIGIQLLEQDGRGIVITEAGKEFVNKAQALLDLEKQILTPATEVGAHFRVGSFESFSTHLLGSKWGQYFPESPLQIHDLSGGTLEKAVADGVIDAAITYEPVPTRDVELLHLGKVSMGIYHRKGFFKKTELSELPFVAPLIPSVGMPSSAKGLDGWPEHEFPRHVKYRVDLMESGLALVRSGVAAIFVPDFVARAQNVSMSEDFKLVERDLPKGMKKVERRIFLVVKPSRQKEKNVVSLIRMIKAECL